LRTSVDSVRPTGTLARAVAKKVRTPPPPKRVQAPQRRETRKAAGIPTRSPWYYAGAGAAVVAVIAGIVIGVILVHNSKGGGSKSSAASVASYNTLPGVRRTKAPWTPEYRYLADRLLPLGLTTLPGHVGLVEHYHAHLDIFVNGKHIVVPALIGINAGAGYLTQLHTHDTRGVIHIESQQAGVSFNLGQFFAEWAVFLNSRCVGAYCNGLKWYVNGKQQTGDPQRYVPKSHDEIAIVVGKPPKKIPSRYAFLAGE
jgi:hypothetical protein